MTERERAVPVAAATLAHSLPSFALKVPVVIKLTTAHIANKPILLEDIDRATSIAVSEVEVGREIIGMSKADLVENPCHAWP